MHSFAHQAQDFRAEAEAIVARQREAIRPTGVCWSGFQTEPHIDDVDALAERLARKHAENEAWRRSPRGLFVAALNELAAVGYAVEVDSLRGIFNRSLADERQPLDVAAVGSALTILEKVQTSDGRAAREALYELLLGVSRRAA